MIVACLVLQRWSCMLIVDLKQSHADKTLLAKPLIRFTGVSSRTNVVT